MLLNNESERGSEITHFQQLEKQKSLQHFLKQINVFWLVLNQNMRLIWKKKNSSIFLAQDSQNVRLA